MSSANNEINNAEHLTRQWLEQVVIGLGLCPFAARPMAEKRVRIEVCDSQTELALLEKLHTELDLLDQKTTPELETTLLVIPNMLRDFDEYNQFLNQADALLDEFSWHGKYQVASFHPQYQFAGTTVDSPENLTNRSPFPVLHLIREDSLSEALTHFARPEDIPVQNISRMNALTSAEQQHYFPWLFTTDTRQSPSK